MYDVRMRRTGSASGEYEKPVTARVPDDDLAALQQLAVVSDRSLSAEIRRAIRLYLRHNKEGSDA